MGACTGGVEPLILAYEKTKAGDFQEEYPDCIICGKSETKFYDRVFDRTFIKCKQCGLVFQCPRIKREQLLEKGKILYDKNYFYNKENTRQMVMKARSKLYQRELEYLELYCKGKGKRIFDVGCGTGRFLSYLPGDWEKHGCDITSKGVEIARDEYGLKNVKLGEFETLNIQKNYFAAVYFRASLHHIYNPLSSLKKANEIMKENGCLVLLTNCRTGWSGKLIRCSTRTVNPRVNFFFDEKTIGQLLNMTGFELKEKYIPYWGTGYENIFDFPHLTVTAARKRLIRPLLSIFGFKKENNLVGPAWHKNSVFYFSIKKR
jgi:ubiquinone/menaquinone biosynthesis C-methylase UbiE